MTMKTRLEINVKLEENSWVNEALKEIYMKKTIPQIRKSTSTLNQVNLRDNHSSTHHG